MNLSPRLDQAITKLYTAFHGNMLNPECCKQCAVGNILNNTDAWKHLSDGHGALRLNYIGQVNEAFGKRFQGYTPNELIQIEAVFLEGCGYSIPLSRKGKRPKNPTDQEVLFNGLCAVTTFLCKLDNVEDVMDYHVVFGMEKWTVSNTSEVSILA